MSKPESSSPDTISNFELDHGAHSAPAMSTCLAREEGGVERKPLLPWACCVAWGTRRMERDVLVVETCCFVSTLRTTVRASVVDID